MPIWHFAKNRKADKKAQEIHFYLPLNFLKMDRYQSFLLIGWIDKNIVDCADSKIHGKKLVMNEKANGAAV